MAIGGDQGGSIRIPSSNCGVYGMKPTHGLVPYTGIMPIEQTIDHVGPITGSVADNALFLEVLAGEDGLDPRQYAPEVHRYTEALGRGCAGLRIGVLKEGFHRPESEPDVDRKVLDAAERFRSLGARVAGYLHRGALLRGRSVDRHRGRGASGRNDARKQLRHEPSGPVPAVDDRPGRHLAAPGRRAVALAQGLHVPRRVLPGELPGPLLRQGAEPDARRHRQVPGRAAGGGSAADADAADEGAAHPAPGLLHRAVRAARVRDGRQHRRVQRLRPAGDVDPVRPRRGPARSG